MPLESQKNKQNQVESSLSDRAISGENQSDSDLKENQSEDAYIDRVLTEANQQFQETEKPEQFTIKISESQEKMAGEVRAALGLAFGVTLNSAVKYALFHAQHKGVSLSKLENFPTTLGSHSLKLKVTPDTLHRLKESGVTKEQLSECVAIGIQLMYERLIDTNHKG